MRVMKNIEPLVKFANGAANVAPFTFTKWGGFYRLTYTIDCSFPHTIQDIKEENLVPYESRIWF